jgi:hypothetical protein
MVSSAATQETARACCRPRLCVAPTRTWALGLVDRAAAGGRDRDDAGARVVRRARPGQRPPGARGASTSLAGRTPAPGPAATSGATIDEWRRDPAAPPAPAGATAARSTALANGRSRHSWRSLRRGPARTRSPPFRRALTIRPVHGCGSELRDIYVSASRRERQRRSGRQGHRTRPGAYPVFFVARRNREAARGSTVAMRSTHPRIGSRLLPMCSLRPRKHPLVAGFVCAPLRAQERQKPLHRDRIRGPAQRPLGVETAGIEPASAIA